MEEFVNSCSSPQSHGRHWHDTGNVRFGRSGLIERITKCEPSLSVQKLASNACIMHYALCYGHAIVHCVNAISIFALKTLECIAFYYTIKPRLYMVSYHNLLYVVTLMPNICSSFLQVTVQLCKEEVHTWKPF